MSKISEATPEQLKYIEENQDKFTQFCAPWPEDEDGNLKPLILGPEDFAKFKAALERPPKEPTPYMKAMTRAWNACTTKQPDGSIFIDDDKMDQMMREAGFPPEDD